MEKLKRGGVITAVLIVVFIVFKLITTSTIIVTVNTKATATNVYVDGKIIALKSGETRTYQTKVGIGSHAVLVKATGHNDVSKDISTAVLSKKELDIQLTEKSAGQTAAEIYKPDAKVTISEAKYYGDKSWILFFVADTSGAVDGSIVVAKYNSGTSLWEIQDEGSYIEPSDPKYDTAPSELIVTLKNL